MKHLQILCIWINAAVAGAFAWSTYAWRDRCLKSEWQAYHDRQLAAQRYDQLKSDVATALGEKPQDGTWTTVKMNGGGTMYIVFVGEQFVEVARWSPK